MNKKETEPNKALQPHSSLIFNASQNKYETRYSLLPFAWLVAVLCGCASSRYAVPTPPPHDFVHLYSKGGWGSDADIWINPDDSFTYTKVDTRDGRVKTKYRGSLDGLFASVVGILKRRDGWEISSVGMNSAIAAVAEQRGEAFGVMDLNHDYLEIRSARKSLKADFYASEAYSKQYPTVKSVWTFSSVVSKIREGTTKNGEPGPRD